MHKSTLVVPPDPWWRPASRFGILAVVAVASMVVALAALGVLGGDDGADLAATDLDGDQQVIAGPRPSPGPEAGAAGPGLDPEAIAPGSAGQPGAVVAPSTSEPTGSSTLGTTTSGNDDASTPGRRGSQTTTTEPQVTTASSGPRRPATTATTATTTSRSTTTRPATTRTSGPTVTTRSTAATRPTTTAQPTTTTRPTTTTTRSTTTTGGSGRIIWQDGFDRLDTSTWRLEHSTYGDGNNELQCYQPDNVSVSGGRLILRAETETVTCPNGSTRQVSSGMVRSRGVTFSPGQAIEFRVKLTPADPNDQGGLWPAVWASGWAGGGWPTGGELDWLEVMTAEDPTRAMFSMHYAGPDGRHQLQNRGVRGGADFSDAWHTIRFDYGQDGRLQWYLDGSPAFSVDAADTIQGYPAPFDQSIGEIKINLALGGRPGPLAPGAVGSTGATFEVDYIRIIQL